MKKRTIVVILIALTALLILFPLFWLQGAEFEGSDGQGSEMVEEIMGEEFEPWFEPILETLIGGELPSEMETLFFCIQTGIGVGIIAFCFGYLTARKKYGKDDEDEVYVSNKTSTQEV
ncbi:MAG: energy-coupling factor ABC transporter substrate-binding protein [Oscillospiraceae bacterium]|nr:energy-coupling factor ABC transporter substrate-binding protein [Oscillospiraceae bacterium]